MERYLGVKASLKKEIKLADLCEWAVDR